MFREQDAELFHGRDDLAAQLGAMVARAPLTAVVGPSGSGKSSLVLAGMLPRLRRPGLVVMTCRPGSGQDALYALASALLPLLEPEMTESERLGEMPKLSAVLREGLLPEVVNRVLAKADGDELLLVVDQFEEVFGAETSDSGGFIESLLRGLRGSSDGPTTRLRVVLTLRADFLGSALEHTSLAEKLRESVFPVGPMTRAQLRSAIEEPARGLAEFEAGLIDRMLDDIGDEPGNLPLLEFALALLWEKQQTRELTHSAYEALGRAAGALSGYAERVYNESVSDDERDSTRRVLTQLVRIDEAAVPTRRMARRAEFDEPRWTVAQRLAATRLVVTGRSPAGDETVELAHETLITRWERLNQWVDADRAFREWQERLRRTLAQWEESGQDDGALLAELPLAEAEKWLTQRHDELSPGEHRFIRASHSHRKRTVHRLQALVVALAVLVMVAGVASLVALEQGRRARHQSSLATSRALVAEADSKRDSDPQLATLLSLAAFEMADTEEARNGLLNQLMHRKGVNRFVGPESRPVASVAFSPDGHTIATAVGDQVALRSATDARILAVLSGHTEPVTSVAFSPDGRTLASGGLDGKVRVWDVGRGADPAILDAANSVVSTVAFSPDGRTLAAASVPETGPGHVVLWDASALSRLVDLSANHGASLAFSPDSTMLASGGSNGQVVLWDVAQHNQIHTFADEPSSETILAVAFSPDGRTLAAAGFGSFEEVVVWDVVSRARTAQGLGGPTRSLAFSPDGRTLAVGTHQFDVALYDAVGLTDDARPRTQFAGHTDIVRAMAFSPDSRTLATGSVDRHMILWDAEDGEIPGSSSLGTTELMFDFALSRDGRLLATSGPSGTVLWDVVKRARVATLDDADGVGGVGFSPDGNTLATGSGGKGRVRLWNVGERSPIADLEGHSKQVGASAFSPDGRTLATGDDAGKVTLWDVGTRAQLATLAASGSVVDLAFSPDGRMLAGGAQFSGMLWDVASRTELGRLNPGKGVGSVAFSPDGRSLATGGPADDNVILWDPTTRDIVATLSGSDGPVAFSPDSRTLATSTGSVNLSSEEGIALWDVARRARLPTLPHSGLSLYFAFAPDGRTFVSADSGGEVVVWDLDPASWHRRLCSLVGRDLSKEEWDQRVSDRSRQPVCR